MRGAGATTFRCAEDAIFFCAALGPRLFICAALGPRLFGCAEDATFFCVALGPRLFICVKVAYCSRTKMLVHGLVDMMNVGARESLEVNGSRDLEDGARLGDLYARGLEDGARLGDLYARGLEDGARLEDLYARGF